MKRGQHSLFNSKMIYPQVLAHLKECLGDIITAEPLMELIVESLPVLLTSVIKETKNEGEINVYESRKAFNLDVIPFIVSKQRELANLESERTISMRQEVLQRTIANIADDPRFTKEHIEASEELDRLARTPKLFTVHNLPRHDDLRCALEMLMLYLVRQFVPLKYRTVEDFLKVYPEMGEREKAEVNRLWQCANWFDVTLLTLKSQNNKSHMIGSLVPRMAEGAAAKYITGSGESCSTRDRVTIFRVEGLVEKVTRAPRKRTNFAKGKKAAHPAQAGASSLEIERHGIYVNKDSNSSVNSIRSSSASTNGGGGGGARKRSRKAPPPKKVVLRREPAAMIADTCDYIHATDSYDYELNRSAPYIHFDPNTPHFVGEGLPRKGGAGYGYADVPFWGPGPANVPAAAAPISSLKGGGGMIMMADGTYATAKDSCDPLDTPPTSTFPAFKDSTGDSAASTGIMVLLDAIQQDQAPMPHVEYFNNLYNKHVQTVANANHSSSALATLMTGGSSSSSSSNGGAADAAKANEGENMVLDSYTAQHDISEVAFDSGAGPDTRIHLRHRVAPAMVTAKPRNAAGVKYGDLLRAMSVRK